MAKLRLNQDWSRLVARYEADHQDPRNRVCHAIGIPLIAASAVAAVSLVGLPLAPPLFVLGWGCQFLGHYFEGKPPSLTYDQRQMVNGALGWARKAGLDLFETTPIEPAPHAAR
jgi:uncharacterized membrane protein YGL010W